MLKKLRRKLVAIVMTLVGAVLVAVLAISVISAQNSYIELTNTSLDSVLDQRDSSPFYTKKEYLDGTGSTTDEGVDSLGTEEDKPSLSPSFDTSGDSTLSSAGHVGVVWVDVSSEGVLLASNQDQISIDADVFEAALTDALASSKAEGTLPKSHVMWKKAETPFGVRIAMADTTNIDANFKKQIIKTVGIGAVALLGLFVLANLLARWALKPVERAWEQQHQFVADASHELKTPLAVILANMQILKKDQAQFPEADQRWITSTTEEAERMRKLVEELLELARTDEGADTARRNDDIDFSDIVEGEAMQFDAVAFERGCTIEEQVEPGLHVLGDAEQLERLTKTLVDNACKYAPENSTIYVALVKHTGYAQLNVTNQNQGTPISEEDLAHLFDRFYRSDKARARQTGGFGLGLAIARGIAESHGGKIWATSTAEVGTTFSVKLPLKGSKA